MSAPIQRYLETIPAPGERRQVQAAGNLVVIEESPDVSTDDQALVYLGNTSGDGLRAIARARYGVCGSFSSVWIEGTEATAGESLRFLVAADWCYRAIAPQPPRAGPTAIGDLVFMEGTSDIVELYDDGEETTLYSTGSTISAINRVGDWVVWGEDIQCGDPGIYNIATGDFNTFDGSTFGPVRAGVYVPEINRIISVSVCDGGRVHQFRPEGGNLVQLNSSTSFGGVDVAVDYEKERIYGVRNTSNEITEWDLSGGFIARHQNTVISAQRNGKAIVYDGKLYVNATADLDPSVSSGDICTLDDDFNLDDIIVPASERNTNCDFDIQNNMIYYRPPGGTAIVEAPVSDPLNVNDALDIGRDVRRFAVLKPF